LLSDLRFSEGAGSDLVIKISGTTDQITIQKQRDASGNWKIENLEFADANVISVQDAWDAFINSGAVGITLTGSGTLQGTAFDDVLNANDALTTLLGGAGNDTLVSLPGGTIGAQTFEGGTGNDTIIGSYCADLYRFNAGDGHDVITDDVNFYPGPGAGVYFAAHPTAPSYSDTLAFGAGINAANVIGTRTGSDLILTIGAGDDSVTVKRWFEGIFTRMEQITFADGTLWTPAHFAMLEDQVEPPPPAIGITLTGSGTLQGTAFDDTLSANGALTTLLGGAGNDTLVSLQGGPIWDQTFEGGPGNDTMTGSYARDVYRFNLGDGHDEITDDVYSYPNANAAIGFAAYPLSPEYQDRIQFGAGISAAQVSGTRVGDDLVLGIGAGDDSITVKRWFEGIFTRIEQISFADGTLWTPAHFAALEDPADPPPAVTIGVTLTGSGTLQGTAFDDTLSANGALTTLLGGAGNDTLVSLQGGPIWDQTFEGGPGNDTMTGSYARDVYRFNLGDGHDEITDDVYSYPNANAAIGFAAYPLSPEYQDRIQFGAGISTRDIAASRSGDDMVLAIGTGGDSIAIKRWFEGIYTRIEEVTFDGVGTFKLSSDLTGGASADYLLGSAGADTLTGQGGNDVLVGGQGGDTYGFAVGDGQDLIVDSDTSAGVQDTLSFGAGIAADQLWLRHVGNDLEVSVIGTSDHVTIADWYSGSAHQIETMAVASGLQLLSSSVNSLVEAMAAFSPPAAGQTTLPVSYQSSLGGVIAANWQ
jgi:Ca2+-binding RTX toxin-like protein